MATMTYDERVTLLNEKKIDILQFVMLGDDKHDFLDWCTDRGIEPNTESAQFYVDMTDEHSMVLQEIDIDDASEIL